MKCINCIYCISAGGYDEEGYYVCKIPDKPTEVLFDIEEEHDICPDFVKRVW